MKLQYFCNWGLCVGNVTVREGELAPCWIVIPQDLLLIPSYKNMSAITHNDDFNRKYDDGPYSWPCKYTSKE
jgi:hypothetical protein